MRLVVFEVHEVNEENCSHDGSFKLDIHIKRERYTKVVRISEHLLGEARPLLADVGYHLVLVAFLGDREVNAVTTPVTWATWSNDLKLLILVIIKNAVVGLPERAMLSNISQCFAMLVLNFDLVSTRLDTGTPAGGGTCQPLEGSLDGQDNIFVVVCDHHLEFPLTSTTLAAAPVGFFEGVVTLLALIV